MKQIFIGRDGVSLQEVPAPLLENGSVLVSVMHSCVSVGTELSGVRSAGTPTWKKVLQDPQKLKTVFASMRKEGLLRTRALVKAKLEALHPVGYSGAGRVLAVGSNVSGIQVGDLVACGGSQWAYHAEVISVPENLTVRVPEGVSTRDASTVSIGSIALQGVRRAAPTLGETFVVVGLGLLGQLTQQLLRVNGVRVIGIDTDGERVQRAIELGMESGWSPQICEPVGQVVRLTGGTGADGVIVTASSSSSEILSQAFRMCRRKARVVLVGDVGLQLRRADIYEKELDFLVSTSYGPGRYDPLYEEGGVDYPRAYVRWTENRNMEEYLRLVCEKRVAVDRLIDSEVLLDDAPDAYRALSGGPGKKLLAVILRYDADFVLPRERRMYASARCVASGGVRLAVIGAGGFAQSTLLPIVSAMKGKFEIRGVVSRHGHNAMFIARQYGAVYGTTNAEEILADPEVDAVLIATRHSDHASQVLAALHAGKHVFVEKPLCLSFDEMDKIEACIAEMGDKAPVLVTGFNRRFSPYVREMSRLLDGRSGPIIIQYTVNAGFIPREHWVHGPDGGGRNLGEACHFYDFFTCLIGTRLTSVTAHPLRPKGDHYRPNDNFVATICFDDGSVATLLYSAMGAGDVSKERVEVFWDGKILQLDDFRQLSLHGAAYAGLKTATPQKGHAEEFELFHKAVTVTGEPPIPFWQQLQASRIALLVEEQLQGNTVTCMMQEL